jgi:hypothetical protein
MHNENNASVDLDKLEALARAATPGPWAYQEDSDAYTHIIRPVASPGWIIASATQTSKPEGEANGRWIAAANPATILSLIDLTRRASASQISKDAGGEPLAEQVRCNECAGTGSYSRQGDCTDCNGKGYNWEPIEQASAAGTGSEQPGGLPNQFRKKPVVIEAIQWPGTKFETTPPKWFSDAMYLTPGAPGFVMRLDNDILIETLEGQMRAQPGDWIIRGIKGELYPCKPDIFAASYEPALALAPLPEQDDDARDAALEEAAGVFESAAKHNAKEGRTVFAHEQQARAERMRAAMSASRPDDKGEGMSPSEPREECPQVAGSVDRDPLYEKAVILVRTRNRASLSLLQRELLIGYNRTARLFEAMEAAGVVSTLDEDGHRAVLTAKETP